MKIRKALITAAGKDQRTLPLQTLIDRDGNQKSVLRIIVEQVLDAGIEEIGIVLWPGDESAFRVAAGDRGERLHFIEQPEPLGYGNAVFCSRDFIGLEPFLHLLGDHIYCSSNTASCAAQLMETALAEDCAVSAVQILRESRLPYYGAIGGRRLPGRTGLFQVEQVLEKPTATEAEQSLLIPGIRAGHYLCFFGMHVLTPTILDLLTEQIGRAHV
jgi:UTP--glucose-1-phosphate uridylyltransferase